MLMADSQTSVDSQCSPFKVLFCNARYDLIDRLKMRAHALKCVVVDGFWKANNDTRVRRLQALFA